MTPRSWSHAGVTLLFSTMLVACNRDVAVPSGVASLDLKSSSFSGDTIPAKYSSCEGESSMSPALKWSAPPAGTQSLALIAIDRDSPFGFRFVHWVLFDLPAETRELPEGIAKQGQLPDGSRQGLNGYDKPGYVGPCPPGHSAHRYVFDVYALDRKLDLPAGVSKTDVGRLWMGMFWLGVRLWGDLGVSGLHDIAPTACGAFALRRWQTNHPAPISLLAGLGHE